MKEPELVEKIHCPYCGAKNPYSAYVCLRCFRVLNPQKKFTLWKLYIPPLVAYTVLGAVTLVVLFQLLSHWLQSVEADVNLDVHSSSYNLSIQAQKKKSHRLLNSFKFQKGQQREIDSINAPDQSTSDQNESGQ